MLAVPSFGPRDIAARSTMRVWSVTGIPKGGVGIAICAPMAVSIAKSGIERSLRSARSSSLDWVEVPMSESDAKIERRIGREFIRLAYDS